VANNSQRFRFDGGAASYFGTVLLASLITTLTLGICYPFALVLFERWKAKHSYIDGHRLIFTGTALGLFGNWIKWFLLCVITFSIYSWWVVPRLMRWIWQHTDFDPSYLPTAQASPGSMLGSTTFGHTADATASDQF
jgi:uncharacterized membrane protein YjgN (DUF898 family)